MRRRDFVQGLTAAWAAPLATALKQGKIEEAAGLIAHSVDQGNVAAATLVVDHEGVSTERAFGAAQDPRAIFLIASITKPMTAAGVMLLADRGELTLSDPVVKFIPEFNEGDRKQITVQHLLTHTSGLPDQLPENVELRQRQAPLKEFVARVMTTPLLFKPGTRVKYQSMGFLLAAEIAERITEKPFPEFLAEEIFQPLGMERSALGLGRFQIADTMRSQVEHAPGLYGGGGDSKSWDWNSLYWRNLAAPWGGAHASGPDIAKFLVSFLRPAREVLKEETAATMIVDHNQGLNEPRGLGFVVQPGGFGRLCSRKAFGHAGATGTLAWADPASGLTCVVLTTLPLGASEEMLLLPVSDRVSEAIET